jgi:LPXTG-motif cell wall-anchored protein
VIRRMLVLGALLVTVMATVAISATAASAQYVPGTPGVIVDPGSTTVGGTVTVTGTGCPANVPVTIKIGTVTVGTFTSNDAGNFSEKITLPPGIAPGQYTVHALCGDLDLTAVLSVTALPPTTVVATTTATTTTLPKTGTDSGAWVKIGLSLVAVGGLLVLATRRRRSLV